jgi:putative acetyltransferase
MNLKIQDISIRPVRREDNESLAIIVRSTLAEFGANHPGTVYYDPTTDDLYTLFQKPRSSYFVATLDSLILGGGGIYPTEGLPGDICELVKMYLVPSARGIGLGWAILRKCFTTARKLGYKAMYIETMPELRNALKLYERAGFYYLDGPLGNSGHFGCDIWMLKRLNDN